MGFHCSRCGNIAIFGPLNVSVHQLQGLLGPLSDARARHRRSRLSHILRRQQRKDTDCAGIPIERLGEWQLDDPLPTAMEQADSLILWAGDRQPSTGEWVDAQLDEVAAWVGDAIVSSPPNLGIGWLLSRDAVKQLLDQTTGMGGIPRFRLTLPGWHRYLELKRGRDESRTAFMAMQFGDPELSAVVDNCFREAVARTGFELRVLTDRQGAGLIDDQLRVALRTARFVIADLTHRNNGAYWEAGFAEGLGKPVIYTCRKDESDKRLSHFDTNHLVTVIWRPDGLPEAGERLVNTIRATLPAEAKMTDS